VIDINRIIDQQELEEERDNRTYGNDEFSYLGNNPIADEEEGE
jgi:hypothetical protein